MTTKTIANGLFKPELWAKELNRKMNDAGVMLDCVNRKYEGQIKNEGDTVNIQTVGDVTIGDYTSSAGVTYQELDGDTQKLVIDQKKYWGFVVDDIEKVQANVEYMSKYTDQAKKGLVNTQDAFLLAKSADVPSGNQLGSVSLTADNAYSVIVDLATVLRENNAIDSSNNDGTGKKPWLVVDPKTLGILLKAPEAIHATALGDEAVRKGTILRLAGFDIKMSTVLKPVADAVTVLAGTTEAITFAEQIIKVESVKDKDRFGDFVRGLYVYGAKTVNPHCLASMTVSLT